jgi:hypothetical protein
MKKSLIAAMAASLMVIGVAHAASSFTTSYLGARANFIDNGDGTYTLEACDRKKDGFRAIAYVRTDRTGIPESAKDTDGAGKHQCVPHKIRMNVKGERVWLQACRLDHDGNKRKNDREACGPYRIQRVN